MRRRGRFYGSQIAPSSTPKPSFPVYVAPTLHDVPYIAPDEGRSVRVESRLDPVALAELLILAHAVSFDSRFPTEPPTNPYLDNHPEPPKQFPEPALLKPLAEPALAEPKRPRYADYKEKIALRDALLVLPAVLKIIRADKRHRAAEVLWMQEHAKWKAENAQAWSQYHAARVTHAVAMKDAEEQHARWVQVCAVNSVAYSSVLARWEVLRNQFEAARTSDYPRLRAIREGLLSGNPDDVAKACYSALARSPYPIAFPFDAIVVFNPDNRLLYIEYLLPNIAEMSLFKSVDRVAFLRSRAANKTEVREALNTVPYAVAIRSMHEVLRCDEGKNIETIAFNGMLRFVDPTNGQIRTECILSVLASRAQIDGIAVERVNPVECFRSLRGIAAAQLADCVPVAPIMKLDRADHRIIESRDVASKLTPDSNLAAMPWEDFEHLIRQTFERLFARDGVEVRVTQASRDRGVDAIAFDPDPLRGGKIVIQAKRYTRVVDVAAVRDLYGTVHNEGANKGILVTTSAFGRDSYEFAQGKPLTLIDGANLLHLLKQQGMEYRIDLEEARRLRPSDYSNR